MHNLLAVDAGGTSSRAVILDRHGRCLGYGRAGGGNPISSGPTLAGVEVAAAARDAIASKSVAPVEVVLNRFDERDEVHVQNRDWLREHDRLRVSTEPEDG